MAITTANPPSGASSGRFAKAYKGPPMEGFVARWYARIRRPGDEIETVVRRVTNVAPPGSAVLEVAPGPGYLAVELARRGGYEVTGLDISRTFVALAREHARAAGLEVRFEHGDASAMPFPREAFDFAVCCAAFKNFTRPVEAIAELHRVLKPGGSACIMDLRRNASAGEVDAYVRELGLSRFNAWVVKLTFRRFLLKNAYTPEEMSELVSRTPFRNCQLAVEGISQEVWLSKEQA